MDVLDQVSQLGLVKRLQGLDHQVLFGPGNLVLGRLGPRLFGSQLDRLVWVDTVKQRGREPFEVVAVGRLGNLLLLVLGQLPVESGQPGRQRRDDIGMGHARGHHLQELIERDGRLAVQRFRGRLVLFADAHRVDNNKMGLVAVVGRHALQRVGIDHANAPAFHLLEIARRFDVPHEEKAFQRLNVGARGDHIDRNGDAWVVGIAELGQ